jgi:hypothetical protein
VTTLKKNPTPGLCHAKSCRTKVTEPSTLCAKHVGKIVDVVDNALLVVRNENLELLTAVANIGLTDLVELEDRTVSGLEFLGIAREEARTTKARFDAQRKEEKQPSLDEGRRIDSAYKPLLDTLESVVKACTTRLLDHARAAAEAQRQALAAVAVAAQSGDMALARVEHERAQNLAPNLPPQVRLETKVLPEIEDIDLVPREWFVLDLKRLTELGERTQGTAVVPGVRWVRVEKVRTA